MPIARNPRAKRLGAGVHLVSIVSIQFAKEPDGTTLVTNRSGENALQIRFKNLTGHDINSRFWLSESSAWILESFYKAIGINVDEKIEVSEVTGRRLWICVAEKRVTKNQVTSIYFELIPKFYKLLDPDVKPAIEGDPLRDGTPSGMFLIEENYDHPQAFESNTGFEENDEIPWNE